jgi:hypothetical protein
MPLSKEEINKRRNEKYALLSEEEKERRRAVSKEYGRAHRQELNEWAKEYRKTNAEWSRAAQKRARKKLKETKPEHLIWMETKKRAKKRDIPFDIEASDIVIPKFCPILKIELSFGNGRVHDSSPSLDRIVPEKGYVKGNCFIISSKANRMKQENTLETLELIINYIKERLL